MLLSVPFAFWNGSMFLTLPYDFWLTNPRLYDHIFIPRTKWCLW